MKLDYSKFTLNSVQDRIYTVTQIELLLKINDINQNNFSTSEKHRMFLPFFSNV